MHSHSLLFFVVVLTGTPFVALTGTSDQETAKTICKELVLQNCRSVFVSPNRTNLRFSVFKVAKEGMLTQLNWLVELIQTQKNQTPKTIIFCPTMYAVASVFNFLLMKSGPKAYYPEDSRKKEHCLLGIFHSLTHQEYKERVVESLKGNGLKRIIVATTALSMGVNFPDIRYVIMWGPPRSLLDFHQEAGRAGRDGLPADIVTYLYGQQLTHCEDDMKSFLKSSECHRITSYKNFDDSIASLSPSHDCCNHCAATCTCTGSGCVQEAKPFEKECLQDSGQQTRVVSAEEKKLINEALNELKDKFKSSVGVSPFGSTSCHGFSEELICDVVDNCHHIFTISDIQAFVPVFSNHHAIKILEILSEIFDDIDSVALANQVHYSSETTEQVDGFEYLIVSDYPDPDLDEESTDLDFVE